MGGDVQSQGLFRRGEDIHFQREGLLNGGKWTVDRGGGRAGVTVTTGTKPVVCTAVGVGLGVSSTTSKRLTSSALRSTTGAGAFLRVRPLMDTVSVRRVIYLLSSLAAPDTLTAPDSVHPNAFGRGIVAKRRQPVEKLRGQQAAQGIGRGLLLAIGLIHFKAAHHAVGIGHIVGIVTEGVVAEILVCGPHGSTSSVWPPLLAE